MKKAGFDELVKCKIWIENAQNNRFEPAPFSLDGPAEIALNGIVGWVMALSPEKSKLALAVLDDLIAYLLKKSKGKTWIGKKIATGLKTLDSVLKLIGLLF